jgi:hypothetical protein
MQLVEPRLSIAGVASRRGPVHLRDVGSYSAAFVTNSRGFVPVGRIDGIAMAVDEDLMRIVAEVVGSVPWDTI